MTVGQSFTKVIDDFGGACDAFLTAAAAVPDEMSDQPGVCGSWSAHEVVAHLAGWMVEANRRYPRFALGTAEVRYDIDVFNDVSVRMRRNKSYDAIIEELHAASDTLIQLARNLPEFRVNQDSRYAEWLISLTREAREHGAQLQTFAQGVR